MTQKTIRSLALAAILALSVSGLAFAQPQSDTGAKQDMRNAGHETGNAAKDTGRGIKKGTKKGYHATKRGTRKAAHKTAHATKKGYHKTANETKKIGHHLDPDKN